MIEIHKASPQDAEEVEKVAKKAWKAAYKEIIEQETIETVIDKWYKIEDLRQQLEDPLFYIAVDNGSIVGFIHATLDEDSDTVDIHRLYLEPQYWREGIGTRLWERLMKEVGSVKTVKLEVLASNEAGKSFYRSKGFEEIEREKVKLFGEPVTQVIMEKQKI